MSVPKEVPSTPVIDPKHLGLQRRRLETLFPRNTVCTDARSYIRQQGPDDVRLLPHQATKADVAQLIGMSVSIPVSALA